MTVPVTQEQADSSRCRQCGDPLNPEAVRCRACGTHADPWYQRPAFWLATVAAVILLVMGAVVWNHREDVQERQRIT